MVWKNSTLMVSAMDEHDDGCPLPAAEVDSTEWMRSLVAMSRRTCLSSKIDRVLNKCCYECYFTVRNSTVSLKVSTSCFTYYSIVKGKTIILQNVE